MSHNVKIEVDSTLCECKTNALKSMYSHPFKKNPFHLINEKIEQLNMQFSSVLATIL